jgi:hypothetical protein
MSNGQSLTDCLADFERDSPQAGNPSTLKLGTDRLSRVQRLLERLARFLWLVQLPQDIPQLGLRLDRRRRERDGGLRFGKRVIQMLALRSQLRTRDMVQQCRQWDIEVSVEDEPSIFNHGCRLNVLELVVGIEFSGPNS